MTKKLKGLREIFQLWAVKLVLNLNPFLGMYICTKVLSTYTQVEKFTLKNVFLQCWYEISLKCIDSAYFVLEERPHFMWVRVFQRTCIMTETLSFADKKNAQMCPQ
jgi:hypothetical protein